MLIEYGGESGGDGGAGGRGGGVERERRKKYQKNVGLLDKISIVSHRDISKISHEKSPCERKGR